MDESFYPKSWWGIKAKQGSFVFYVCPAYTKQEAREIFGLLCKGRFVFQLTWTNLIDLLGIGRPFGFNDNEYAFGDLAFRRMGKSVVLWMDKRKRG